MRRKLLPLNALRTFEAAARLLSFKDAAAELGVTPTTVSNQIRQLERDWGCPLFVRKARKVVLTEKGRSLCRVLTSAFDQIGEEVARLPQQTSKPVHLAVGPIFGSRWLIPRLSLFRQEHPDVILTLHHGPRLDAAENMTADVAVDWGYGSWPGLEAEELLRIDYIPIVSGKLLRERGPIRAPADLARFPIIHQVDDSEWRAWLKLAGVPGVRFSEEMTIEDSNVITQAVIDGQGVALGIFPFIQSDVDAGRLIKPLDIVLAPERAFYMLTRPNARQREDIDIVCTWLLDKARE